jgi:hypothetical protein
LPGVGDPDPRGCSRLRLFERRRVYHVSLHSNAPGGAVVDESLDLGVSNAENPRLKSATINCATELQYDVPVSCSLQLIRTCRQVHRSLPLLSTGLLWFKGLAVITIRLKVSHPRHSATSDKFSTLSALLRRAWILAVVPCLQPTV